MLERRLRSTSGFSLTEVMIGIMILTVAIVSATNLLVSMVKTNKVNVQTMQAYYLAQEGIEAIRNIRDTNWLHNLDFMDNGLYGELEYNKYYSVSLFNGGWSSSSHLVDAEQITDLDSMRAWDFQEGPDFQYNDVFALEKNEIGGYITYGKEDPTFYRYIQILDACDNDLELKATQLPDECEDFMLVRSVVEWKDGGKEREMVLEAVLSNWKGGAL
jgi:prepilin-type N-terminal cleavage/methylation domain-containing protein